MKKQAKSLDFGARRKRIPEKLAFLFFGTITLFALLIPLKLTHFSTPNYAPMFSAILSIGTSGLVAFLFYYIVTDRSEEHRRRLVRDSVQGVYLDAKRNIIFAVIHASQKGGRRDLNADFETAERLMTPSGFRGAFEGGREGTEGFYAFENQMDSSTPEYQEIIFNLKVIARSIERLVDNGPVEDRRSYDYFVHLSTDIARIEANGPGYDESKPLCRLIYQIFTGWNFVDGHTGRDPIAHAIACL